jgi:hypothetical protein
MESGDAHQAVALLHQAAARDVSGQVSRRLWGERHPYRSLWPEDLELSLDMQVPAGVAAGLGWNRLQDGGSVPPAPDTRLYEEVMPWVEPVTEEAAPVEELDLPSEELCPDQPLVKEAALAAAVPQVPEEPEPLQMHGLVPAVREALIAFASLSQVSDQIAEEPEPEGRAGPAVMPSRPCPPPRSEELLLISQELERLATRMKLPGITHLDGRYPVYVIFSMRNSLEAIYGSQEADALVIEMKRLVETVRRRRGWSARLFLADDASCTEPLGIQPAWPGDPWGLKLALADLDAALSHRGERIGAVLIVGGPEIVPFHQLPNPVDDQDVDVPSDNPYATCDKNYFVPEWPVGRLPGGSGESAALLLKALRSIRAQHAQQARWLGPGRRLRGMADLWRSGRSRKRANFGYTAAVWQRAASSVFKPIGKPKAMHVSPPLGIIPESQAEHGDVPLPAGLLGYFNLHGLVDAAEWYGQRDPLDSHSESDYPIALRPQDIEDCQKSRCKIPQVVFSEACYGAHIQGKTAEEAISLKFLEAGSLAVVGSTCMAYGSIGAPLIAADLLGQSFWRLLQQGMAAGEALRQAKLCLANEMQQRQGYLDGEDQKTIVSFVLYGDPLAQPIVNGRSAKSARYLVKPLTEVKTICDRAEFSVTDQAIPAPVMASVRRAVARYLPGMSGANLALTHERECCDGYGHACPTSQLGEVPASASPLNQDGNQADKAGRRSKHGPRSGQRGPRSLVTLSKQVESPVGVHAQYARLTLDEAGKLVKLVVSR